MRIKTLIQLLLPLTLMGFSFLMMTGGLSTSGLYDAYQRMTSGVNGRASAASHTVTVAARIAPLDGYTYAGQLDATITFADADGAQTVFDLHYPADYNAFHDGFGPLWLANWRPDLANNPQVSPVLGNSCLQTMNGENLAPSLRYRSAYKDYIVCRVLDEEGPNAPRSYDITKAKPAVIGVLWASRNHQPADITRERCIAEARIWSREIAKPEDRFMACVFVVAEKPQQVEVFTFELTGDSIIEVGGAGEGWSRDPVKTREAPRLTQYRLMQAWLTDPEAREAAAKRAYAHVSENLDQVIPQRLSGLDSVAWKSGRVNFAFVAKSASEMRRIRKKSKDSESRHLYQHIRKLVCGSDERAALLAFQENSATYTYDLNRKDGRPMTMFATFPNLPC
ncbi:hypothetical protein [Rhodalgimonas zhirmunskyi]|uniref:Uncharacterized protein n=1 Tax=Rhodalgimonas zhirmunskyi TaxID=2964767 RepID=A0AAJ1X6C1_9RHOB|nr:hypothetical protein [Rhodoalgimonas zhirmunskyi]MDQ2095059.1 hypothetical protein [Rhodoalgimonas zhirmunskyi]